MMRPQQLVAPTCNGCLRLQAASELLDRVLAGKQFGCDAGLLSLNVRASGSCSRLTGQFSMAQAVFVRTAVFALHPSLQHEHHRCCIIIGMTATAACQRTINDGLGDVVLQLRWHCADPSDALVCRVCGAQEGQAGTRCVGGMMTRRQQPV